MKPMSEYKKIPGEVKRFCDYHRAASGFSCILGIPQILKEISVG